MRKWAFSTYFLMAPDSACDTRADPVVVYIGDAPTDYYARDLSTATRFKAWNQCLNPELKSMMRQTTTVQASGPQLLPPSLTRALLASSSLQSAQQATAERGLNWS